MHKFTNLGLTYGIITAGQSASGFALNFVITGFLNPHNDSPDIVRSNTRHFSQPEILDRVPYLFLLLSAIYLVPAAVTGMRAPPAPPDIDKVTTLTQTTDKNNQVSNKENNEGHTASTESTTTKALSESTQLITKDAVTVERQGPQQEAEEKGVDTKHLFLEKDFYLIWFVAFCGFFVSSSCVGLYKEMGLSRNPDDVYMAALITTGAVCTTLARPVWGIVVDRLGIKRSVMLQGGSCCILTGFWYWALLRGEVIYFLWTILLFVAMSPPKIFIALATKAYFGQLHFFTNFVIDP
nr:hypothetical protein BaRGS_031298 [Batillaria attramentaria]